jgi:predicted nuclease with TOPRIM domain
MINIDEIEQLDKEVQEQTELLKTNTEALENDLKEFKEVHEVLNMLELENADLEQRLAAAEVKYTELQKRLAATEVKYTELQKQVSVLEDVISKRDNVMKILLKTVGQLNSSVTEIRNSLSIQNS